MKRIFIFAFFAASLWAQSNDAPVAAFGDEIISLDEFKKRFQLTPLSSYAGSAEEINRRYFLYTLCAEKLWAKEAVNLGFDTSETMKTTFKALEKMFVRDAFFKQEIENKVKLSAEEIAEEFQRASTFLAFNFLFSSDSIEIFFLYKLLQSGENFDSILSKRDEYLFQPEPFEYEYEKVEDKISDELFKLNGRGAFSSPINENGDWFIFFIREKMIKDVPPNERQKLLSKVKDDLHRHKVEESYQKFHKHFFAGKKIETDGTLFWSLRDKIWSIFNEKKSTEKTNQSVKLKLDNEDFERIEKEFGQDSLSLPFFKIQNEALSFIEFLRAFRYEGFFIDTLDGDILSARMNFRVKNMIEQEMLAREAYLRGFHKLPEVESDIKLWKESYLYNLFRNSFRDSIAISDQELRSYYDELINDSTSLQINIAEILTDSLEVIEIIFSELQKGADFKTLAEKYTSRTSTKNNGGEFGFQPVYALGEIGRIAAAMKVGEIYGPIKLNEGYSLFKLLGKKESFAAEKSFDDAKEKLIEQLKAKIMEEMIDKKTVEFAKKYQLELNEEFIVNKSEIENLRMLVFRLMGFGGKITAVPLTPLYYEWMEDFKKQQEDAP